MSAIPLSPTLDAELDALFRGPVAAFVGARNQLVQGLRAAGQRERAAELARLQRPSPVAWTLNQVHFEARDLLDALRSAGASLRTAQESGAEEYSSPQRAHQEALRATAARAFALAADNGVNLTADLKRRIELNLNLLSATDDVQPPPGRMTAELEPLGFDALSLDAPLAPPPRKPAAAPERSPEILAVQAALTAAEKEAERLGREAEIAEVASGRAARDAEDAEQRAATTRRRRDDAARAATEARGRADGALRELEEARRALEELRRSGR